MGKKFEDCGDPTVTQLPQMTFREEAARMFATEAHGSICQKRKYTGEDYIVHPAAVAEIVRSVPNTPEMLMAAWLHDVVEDTPVTLAEIETEFGAVVASLVSDLTDVSKPSDGDRPVRKALDRAHTAMAAPQAKTIKLADLIDNNRSSVRHALDFARVYLTEKAKLLEVLKEGERTLWLKANELLFSGMLQITAGKSAADDMPQYVPNELI